MPQCTQPECSNVASFTYLWPWGQRGACCPDHKPAIDSLAAQLGHAQGIQFTLVPDYEPPKPDTVPPPAETRAELDDARVRIRELETEVEQLEDKLEEASEHIQKLNDQNVVLEQKVLLYEAKPQFQIVSQEPTELEPTTVVDGPAKK